MTTIDIINSDDPTREDAPACECNLPGCPECERLNREWAEYQAQLAAEAV